MYAPARPLLEEPLKGFEWLQSPMVCPRQAGTDVPNVLVDFENQRLLRQCAALAALTGEA